MLNPMKVIIVILLVAALGGGAYYAYTNKDQEPAENIDTNTVSGMRVEENAVVTPQQRPGGIVTVAQVYLAAPGYVVIHEDESSAPGAILGSSALLQAGENTNVAVTLSRASRDGEKLWAMLHSEKEGNTTFSAQTDTPIESRLGGPISGWFEISAEASGSVEISI